MTCSNVNNYEKYCDSYQWKFSCLGKEPTFDVVVVLVVEVVVVVISFLFFPATIHTRKPI